MLSMSMVGIYRLVTRLLRKIDCVCSGCVGGRSVGRSGKEVFGIEPGCQYKWTPFFQVINDRRLYADQKHAWEEALTAARTDHRPKNKPKCVSRWSFRFKSKSSPQLQTNIFPTVPGYFFCEGIHFRLHPCTNVKTFGNNSGRRISGCWLTWNAARKNHSKAGQMTGLIQTWALQHVRYRNMYIYTMVYFTCSSLLMLLWRLLLLS